MSIDPSPVESQASVAHDDSTHDENTLTMDETIRMDKGPSGDQDDLFSYLPNEVIQTQTFQSDHDQSKPLSESNNTLSDTDRYRLVQHAWRIALDSWSLESSCDLGLTKSIIEKCNEDDDPTGNLRAILGNDLCDRWIFEANGHYEDENNAGPLALPTLLTECYFRTTEMLQNLDCSKNAVTLEARLKRRILQRTLAIMSVTLAMLRKRKFQKLISAPRLYLEKMNLDSEVVPLDPTESQLTSLMKFSFPPEMISFTQLDTHLLGSPSYTTYSIVHTIPLNWLIDKVRAAFIELKTLWDRHMSSLGVASVSDMDVFEEDHFAYELVYLDLIQDDKASLYSHLEELAVPGHFTDDINRSQLSSGQPVIPLFRQSDGPWIHSGSVFVANDLLMHSFMSSIQGIISSIPS